jgi:hypothetical protein
VWFYEADELPPGCHGYYFCDECAGILQARERAQMWCLEGGEHDYVPYYSVGAAVGTFQCTKCRRLRRHPV